MQRQLLPPRVGYAGGRGVASLITPIARAEERQTLWHYHDGFGWWMVIPGTVMLVSWGSVLWLALQFVRGVDKGRDRRHTHDPHDAARRRLARGDITEEEYDRIAARLRR